MAYGTPAPMASSAPPASPSPYSTPVSTPSYGAPGVAGYGQAPPATSPGWATPPAGYAAPAGYGTPAAPAPGGVYPLVAGKPRSFGIGLLLVIVTLGIYGYVWQYKVFKEVDNEHGYEHEQIWFWLGLFLSLIYIGIIFAIVYMVKEINKLNKARQSRGMMPGITPGVFYLWGILGALIIVGPFIAYYQLQKSLNETWADAYRRKGVPWPLT